MCLWGGGGFVRMCAILCSGSGWGFQEMQEGRGGGVGGWCRALLGGGGGAGLVLSVYFCFVKGAYGTSLMSFFL